MKLSQHLTLNFNNLQFVSILPELSLIKTCVRFCQGPILAMPWGKGRGKSVAGQDFGIKPPALWALHLAQNPPPANFEEIWNIQLYLMDYSVSISGKNLLLV